VAVLVGVPVEVGVRVGELVVVAAMVGVAVGSIMASLCIWLSRLPTDEPSSDSHLKW
jgi:hypothetical protein